MQTWQIVVIAVIGIVLLTGILSYFILVYICHKPKPGGIRETMTYVVYLFIAPFCLPFEETFQRRPSQRRGWLKEVGLKEGQAYLEEGFGLGTSPLIACRMVSETGHVYALDNQPTHIAILKARAKVKALKNLTIILSDAKETGLPNESVDTVFISDAFHMFGDKEGTLKELYRVLKPDGTLSMWDETKWRANKNIEIVLPLGLFSLEEQDKAFIKFKKLQAD